MHELELGVVVRKSECEAADTAEAVYANLDHRACGCVRLCAFVASIEEEYPTKKRNNVGVPR